MDTRLLLLLSILLFSCNKESELIECWQANYSSTGFDFKASLDDLEEELKQNHSVSATTKEEWGDLMISLENQDIDYNKLEAQINDYVPADQFYECMGEDMALDEEKLSDEEFKYGVLFSIYHVLSRDRQKIAIKLDRAQKIYISGKEVSEGQLHESIENEIKRLTENGIAPANLTARLSIDDEVKMRLVTKVQEVLMASDVKKIEIENKLMPTTE